MKNSEFHKVLAYGSNLDSEDWDKFVARYAQSNVVFRSLGKVLIPDYGLVFDKYAHTNLLNYDMDDQTMLHSLDIHLTILFGILDYL